VDSDPTLSSKWDSQLLPRMERLWRRIWWPWLWILVRSEEHTLPDHSRERGTANWLAGWAGEQTHVGVPAV